MSQPMNQNIDKSLVLGPDGKTVLYKIMSGEDIGGIQRTARGRNWDEKLERFHEMLLDSTKRKRLDDSFLEVKGVGVGSVHSDQFLTNLSQAYANDTYIGERLILSVPVQKRTNKYAVYPQREAFEAPSDLLTSERARANEVSHTRSSASYELLDYGLENFVSNETLENQDMPFNERADMVAELSEHMARKREVRDATLLTTASNYGSGNTVTLAGSDQWDSAAGGNPIKDVQTAKAALFNGPGATDVWGFTSLSVFNTLARHAQLLDLQKYTINGLISPEGLARYLGLAGILIGEARKQTANEGQTASFSRIWGLDFGVIRVARSPSLRTACFASRFRKQNDPVVTEWFDPIAGKSGGYYVKNAVSEDAKIIASFGGYIIKAAVSA